MNALETRIRVQQLLGVSADGRIGPATRAAFEALISAAPDAVWPIGSAPSGEGWHDVIASSFADPADIRAFKRCKATGKSDRECFAVGDNGIGKWGDDTTGPTPMCALPPEDWQHLGAKARGAKVEVTIIATGRTVICELRDTMPARRNVKNGAGIDLAPGACAALGLRPPFKTAAAWRWA